MMERLHKFLAHCGIASRRKSEEIILEGRVEINGEIVMELGVQIDPQKDRVTVDGKPVRMESKVYYLMNKPKGYTTTVEDELGRRTVLDLLESDVMERVYPAGRLDRDSEGLVVLTNDGDLSYFLTHPSKGVKKVYHATVEGEVTDDEVDTALEKGVRLGPVLIKPLGLKILKRGSRTSVVEVTVAEGVNREVRRMFAAMEHEVKKLVRISIGPLLLKGIPRGKYRKMRRQELALLDEWMARGGSKGAAELAQKLRGRGGRGSSGIRRATGKPDPASNKSLSAKKPPRKKTEFHEERELDTRPSRNIRIDDRAQETPPAAKHPLAKRSVERSDPRNFKDTSSGGRGKKSGGYSGKNKKREGHDYSSVMKKEKSGGKPARSGSSKGGYKGAKDSKGKGDFSSKSKSSRGGDKSFSKGKAKNSFGKGKPQGGSGAKGKAGGSKGGGRKPSGGGSKHPLSR